MTDDQITLFTREAHRLRVDTEDRLFQLERLEADLAAGAAGARCASCTEMLAFTRAALGGTAELIQATLQLAESMKQQRDILCYNGRCLSSPLEDRRHRGVGGSGRGAEASSARPLQEGGEDF